MSKEILLIFLTFLEAFALAIPFAWLILFMVLLLVDTGFRDDYQETGTGWFLRIHLIPFKWGYKKLKSRSKSEADMVSENK